MKYSTAVLLALAFSSSNALTIKSRLTQDTAATEYGAEGSADDQGEWREKVHEWLEDLPEGVTDKIEEHVGSWGDFDLENVDLEHLEAVKDKLVEKLGSKISSAKKSKLKSVWSKVKSHIASALGNDTEEDVPATEEAVRRAQ